MCHMGNNDRLTVVCYIALGCPSADGAGSGRISTLKSTYSTSCFLLLRCRPQLTSDCLNSLEFLRNMHGFIGSKLPVEHGPALWIGYQARRAATGMRHRSSHRQI